LSLIFVSDKLNITYSRVYPNKSLSTLTHIFCVNMHFLRTKYLHMVFNTTC